jgi:hypothetical protein
VITAAVERWRPTVSGVLDDLEAIEPERFTVLDDLQIDRGLLGDIILGIIQTESAGDPNASGDAGCSYGLMQFNWCTRAGSADTSELLFPIHAGTQYLWGTVKGPTELLEPYKNVALGARYFLKQLNEFRDVPAAILAYNAPGATRKWIAGVFTAPVNQAYLDKILSFLEVPAGYFADLVKKNPLLVILGLGLLALVLVNAAGEERG